MKKLCLLVLAVTLLFSLIACSKAPVCDSESETVENAPSTETVPETDKEENNPLKLKGTIIAASGFSEGLSLVNVAEDTDHTYCIDTSFNVVFTLNEYVKESDFSKFSAGYVTLSGTALCDTKGNVTTAESLGVTSFPSLVATSYVIHPSDPRDPWRRDGYIIATDYTNQTMGVLDTDLKWIVEPNKKLFTLFEQEAMTATYVADGYFYLTFLDWSHKYVNIETMAVTDELPFALPSENWVFKKGRFENYEGEVVLDLSHVSHADLAYGYGFKNDVCPMSYYDPNTQKQYFNLINEAGEFLFAPIEVETGAYVEDFTSKTVLVWEKHTVYSTYDMEGNFICRFSFDALNGDDVTYSSYSVKSVDGDILVVKAQWDTKQESTLQYLFYTPRFELIR